MIISSLEVFTHKLSEANASNLGFLGTEGTVGRLASLYTDGIVSGYANPTTATALYASSYSENIANINYPFDVHATASGDYSIIGARIHPTAGGVAQGGYLFIDRLSHQGGLNATGTTAQTTNLPTASLPRYTDGLGVFMGLELYANVGNTSASITINYTNSDGTPSQTTQPIQIGATGFREQGRVLIPSLAAGSKGVRSVESVTLNSTTGTAGNFGVFLFKPLFMIPINNPDGPHICDLISGNLIGYCGNLDRQTNLSILVFIGGNNNIAFGGALIMAYEEQ